MIISMEILMVLVKEEVQFQKQIKARKIKRMIKVYLMKLNSITILTSNILQEQLKVLHHFQSDKPKLKHLVDLQLQVEVELKI